MKLSEMTKNNPERDFYFNLLKEMVNNKINKDPNFSRYQEKLIIKGVKIIDLYYNSKTGIYEAPFSSE
jgi:NifB/MoaA-like Fe-S oxidoreductase